MSDTQKWKKDSCSANKSDMNFTCYSKSNLEIIKQKWNNKHPDNKIETNDSKTIWQELKKKFKTSCKRESCWLRDTFIKHNIDSAQFYDSELYYSKNPRIQLNIYSNVKRRIQKSIDSLKNIK